MNKSNKNLKMIVRLAVVAAIYVALTLGLYPLSYGAVQFRVSEAMMMLVAYNPIYAISMIIGCLISNLASPMGVVDIVFGTIATAVSCIPMLKIKNKYLSSIMPSIANAIIIGLELYFAYQINFGIAACQVFAGEFVVVTLIGVPLFKALEKNPKIVELLEFKNLSKESKFDSVLNQRVLLSLGFMIIGLVLYFNLGLYNVDLGDGSYDVYMLRRFTFEIVNNRKFKYLIILLISPILTFISSICLKKTASAIVNIVLQLISIVTLIVALTKILPTFEISSDYRFYFYFVYFLIIIGYELFSIIHKNKEIEEVESNIYNEIN